MIKWSRASLLIATPRGRSAARIPHSAILFQQGNNFKIICEKVFLKVGTPVGCILSLLVVLYIHFDIISGMKALSTNRAAEF